MFIKNRHDPPCLIPTIVKMMKRRPFLPFPIIEGICPLVKSVLILVCVMSNEGVPLGDIPMEKYLERVNTVGAKKGEL